MDQNQTADNNLQQAIDNINNPAGASNPISPEQTATIDNAAPGGSVAPDGGTPDGTAAAPGVLDEPIGPFPDSEQHQFGVVTQGPEPIAPVDPIAIPDLGDKGDATVTPAPDHNQNPFTTDSATDESLASGPLADALNSATPTPEVADSNPEPESTPSDPAPTANAATDSNESTSAESTPDSSTTPLDSNPDTTDPTPETPASPITGDANEIKKAALDALKPLMKDQLTDVSPEKKFDLCRTMIEDLHDSTMYDEAYDAASKIENADDRAKALLYIIESIDGQE